MRVSDALAVYLVQLQADGRSVHTIKQAQRHARLFAVWAGDPLINEVGHELIARFLASDAVRLRADGGPREPTSGNAIRSSVRGFCAFAHAAGYTPTNAARLVRRARTRAPSPRALSEADMAKLMSALAQASTPLEQRDNVMFTLMARTGLRLGSLVGLDIEDIDFDERVVHLRVLKNGGDDWVLVPDEALQLLREHVGERRNGPLFVSSHGARIGARHVRRRLEQWGARAGVASIHPHALRHAFGQAMYARTQNLLVVSRMLTHRSISASQVYVQMDRSGVRRALARS